MTLSDKIVLLFLSLTCVVAGIGLLFNSAFVNPFIIHVLLLVAFALLCYWLSHKQGYWVDVVRALVTVNVFFTLYTTLSFTNKLFGIEFDAFFAKVDSLLFFGTQPAFWVEHYLTPRITDFFAWVYFLFIPYLYFSIFINCIGREKNERIAFLNGFAVVYGISLLGYLFLPTTGPVEYLANGYHAPLSQNAVLKIIEEAVAQTGGNHGAFPSIHVAASLYCSLFDLKVSRLRGWIYLLLVALIAISTIVLRYHYVIDLIVGAAIALFAVKMAFRSYVTVSSTK